MGIGTQRFSRGCRNDAPLHRICTVGPRSDPISTRALPADELVDVER
jgi:hypothetical protein